jgi:hypothetical protein
VDATVRRPRRNEFVVVAEIEARLSDIDAMVAGWGHLEVGGAWLRPLIPPMGWVVDPSAHAGRRGYYIEALGDGRLDSLGVMNGDIVFLDEGLAPADAIARPNPDLLIRRAPEFRVVSPVPACDPDDPLCGL